MFEDTKGVIRSRKSMHWSKEKGDKNKQRYTKHYTEN